MNNKPEFIKLSLNLSPETNNRLKELAAQNFITKTELLRKALALIDIAMRNKDKGYHLAIIDKEDKKIAELLGL